MKCIILLTLVALCYSYTPYGLGSGRNISVNPDGSITITSVDGRRFTYFKGAGPYSAGYSTGYQSYGYQPYLVQLLQKYQGDISPYNYQQLLEEVREAVQAGQVRGDIYDTLQGLNQFGRGYYGPSQLSQLLRYTQQGRYQQYPGAYVYSPQYGSYLRGSGYQSGISSYSPFYSKLFSRAGYGYGQYGQVQPVIPQLSQVIQDERQILGEQDQIQKEQIVQQLQQQKLYQQQLIQQKEQQQQQKQQQYLQEFQEELQQDQEQVLGEEQRLQQQQYQPQGYGGFRNYLSGGRLGSQSPYFWQQYYGVYPLGRSYGGYGYGFQRPGTAYVY